MLNTEAMTKVHVAFGTIVNEIKEVSRSYKEAKMAMDVGKIFYPDKNVIAYSRLGIGRLIYQLPYHFVRMFIKMRFLTDVLQMNLMKRPYRQLISSLRIT